MSYSLFILPRAQRELAALAPQQRQKITQAIMGLRENPRPANCRKLTGRDGWRIRIGDYRVIYEINDAAPSLTVLHIGHRREVYR